MAEEGKVAADAATKPAAEPAADAKKKKGASGAADKSVGKFTHGDHMVHILFQKGKKFIAASPEDR